MSKEDPCEIVDLTQWAGTQDDPEYNPPEEPRWDLYTPTQELRWLIIITPEGEQQVLQQHWVTFDKDHKSEWRDVAVKVEDRREKK